jgi:outer membrane receptor protein involved in Fe transport
MVSVTALLVAVTLSVSAPLSGTVRSADGVPIAGATVVVRQNDRDATATTNEAGAYSFPDVTLPAVVEARAGGFTSSSRLVSASPADFTLTPASVRETVVVSAMTGAVGNSYWRDGATGQTSLSREDLDAQPAITPDESLRVLAGFTLFRRSSARASNPTTHGVTMRGLSASGASRGLVLFDGVPLNDGFGGWVLWSRVPTDAIGAIEIARGAEGDVFGSDALGGVINIQSGGGTGISFRGEGGSHGLGSAGASGGYRKRQWTAFGAASWFTNDGVIPLETASRGAIDRPASADWTNAIGRAEAGWDQARLSVAVWGGREERGNGTALQWNRMRGHTTAVSFHTFVRSTGVNVRLSAGPNNFDQTFSSIAAGRVSETLTSTVHLNGDVTRGVVEVGHGVPQGYLVGRYAFSRTGFDYIVEFPTSTSTRAVIDDTDSVSLHAGFTPLDRLTVGAGVRRESRKSPDEGLSRKSATIGHVSASWLLPHSMIVRGSVATSHRWPTLNELIRAFQVGSVLTLPNEALTPERARSGDVAFTFEQRRWDASVTGFWSVVNDAVANVTQSTGSTIVRRRQNAGEARARGVEIDAEVRLNRMRLRASSMIVDARFRNSLEPALEGNRLPQVPRATFALFGDAALPWSTTASFVLRSGGAQFDDDRNVFKLAKATQIDAQLAGRVSTRGRIRWHVVVENALDARIEIGRTPLVTLAPGRVVRTGVTWSR